MGQTVWGAILIAYLVPYVVWIMGRDQTLEARKELYGERPEEARFDATSRLYGMWWASGLCLLLLAWAADLKPLGVLALFAPMALAVGLLLRFGGFSKFLAVPLFRFWVAGACTWLLAVAAWYAVFQEETSLEPLRVALLALLPPMVALAGASAYRWAKGRG